MHRLSPAHTSTMADEQAESDQSLHYQPEPLVLARLRDACCEPWPAFQPAVRRLMCSTLDAVTDVIVQHTHEQLSADALAGSPAEFGEGGALEHTE